jgi:hypothetical protein
MKRLLFFLFSILTIITGCEKDIDVEQLNSGSVKVDFVNMSKFSGNSLTLEGITFTVLSDPSSFVNGIPTGIPPSPVDCDKLDDNYGSFTINNFHNPENLKGPDGLQLPQSAAGMAGPGMLGADLSKFSKIDSIRVTGYEYSNYSFLSVCDSNSKKALTFYQNGLRGFYTKTVKIGMKVNTFLYYGSFGYLYSIEIFHQ